MRYLFVLVCAWALGMFSLAGCSGASEGDGTGDSAGSAGSGGSAGTGGSAGAAGTGGSAGGGGSGGIASLDITPGMWSRWAAGTAVCIFVNEDGTALVPDVSCDMTPSGDQEWAFEFRTNRQEGCAITYPHAADEPKTIPIVDNSFELDLMQGDNAITFSGTFTSDTAVSGRASSSAGCPIEAAWSAIPGDNL